MFFRRTTSYALRALLYLSEEKKGQVFTSGEISASIHLPKDYISKILQQLTKANIVGSKKGKGGGFYLAKDSGDIKLIDVVFAVEDNFDMDACVFGISRCNSSCQCPIHDSYGKLKDDFKSMLISYKLSELKNINYANFPFT